GFLSKWIRSKQTIASCMPIRGKSWICRMINDRKINLLPIDLSREVHPVSSCTPDGVTLFARAASIHTRHALVIQGWNGRGDSRSVGEDLRLVRWMLQLASNAYAQHALLVICQRDFF